MNLPSSVQEIADVLGTERALFLIGRLPKSYSSHHGAQVILYVPSEDRLKPDHQLVRILGWNDAVKLCRHFPGEILKPANCSSIYRVFRDKHILRMLKEGHDTKTLADWFGVSPRMVNHIAGAAHANDNTKTEIPQEEKRA